MTTSIMKGKNIWYSFMIFKRFFQEKKKKYSIVMKKILHRPLDSGADLWLQPEEANPLLPNVSVPIRLNCWPFQGWRGQCGQFATKWLVGSLEKWCNIAGIQLGCWQSNACHLSQIFSNISLCKRAPMPLGPCVASVFLHVPIMPALKWPVKEVGWQQMA